MGKKLEKTIKKINITDNVVKSVEDIKLLKKNFQINIKHWEKTNTELYNEFKRMEKKGNEINYFKLEKIKRDLKKLTLNTKQLLSEIQS